MPSCWQSFDRPSRAKSRRNRLQWVLAACHLLWHPSLRSRSVDVRQLTRLLVQDLTTLAGAESADTVRTDDERREELIRRTLRRWTSDCREKRRKTPKIGSPKSIRSSAGVCCARQPRRKNAHARSVK